MARKIKRLEKPSFILGLIMKKTMSCSNPLNKLNQISHILMYIQNSMFILDFILIIVLFENFQSGRKDETLPDQEAIENLSTNLTLKENNNRLKVFTDLKMVKDHLTDERYEFVDDITKADIIFIQKHFKEYKWLLIKKSY